MARKGLNTTSEPLEIEEYYRLIECLRKDRKYKWELFCLLACSMALRVSDALRLKWEDVLGVEVCFVEEGKTKKVRRVILNPSVQKKISELYILMGKQDKNALIFGSPRTGRPYTTQNVNAHLRNFKKKYLLPVQRFSSHSMRKTFGRKVYNDHNQSEHGLTLLRKTFKHTDIRVTERYIGIAEREYDEVYDAITF